MVRIPKAQTPGRGEGGTFMKNKFMTKALAVVLSASMALSLSSATALTANAAAAPKLAKKTVSVKAGKKAKNKLKAASYKAGWRITKATVKKTAVAKAKVKKNKKVVVVTGVKKGATKIVLALKNAKTGAAKKLKFKAKVKVDTPVIVEPVVETASVTAAKQKTFDSVELTFDKEIDATAVSIETVAINGSVGAATSVTIGEDKKSATVVFGYAENTEYTFSVTNLGGTATVKVGSYKVTDISIADQTVEAGSDQDIVYALVAGDVDVTKYNNYTDYVTFDFEGDYTSYSADPTKPKINFADRDKTATVTVKYNNGVDAEISKTVKITSIAATATAGGARFADKLLKWYLVDNTTESFGITPDGSSKTVVFYAKNDKDGKAIKFDDIEVASSNENVATVSWEQNANGKYYILTVDPAGNAGNAKMTIKTTEYKGTEEVHGEYSFDVVSKEFNNNLYNVEAGSSSEALYNSPYAPTTKVAMKPVNSLGETVSVEWDVACYKGSDSTSEIRADHIVENGEDKILIDALGAKAGTYKVEVIMTGESGNNTKEIKKNINVRVTDAISGVMADDNWKLLSDGKIYGTVANEVSATYKVEVKDLKITDYQGKDLDTEVKLAVYVGSKPVGYLSSWSEKNEDNKDVNIKGIAGYESPNAISIATKAISKTTGVNPDLDNIRIFVYSGAKYYWNTANVLDYWDREDVKLDDGSVDGVSVKGGTYVASRTMFLGQLGKNEYNKKEAISGNYASLPLAGKISLLSAPYESSDVVYSNELVVRDDVWGVEKWAKVPGYKGTTTDGKVAIVNDNGLKRSITEYGEINDIYYYGDGSAKNNIASAGSYNVVIKYTDTASTGTAYRFEGDEKKGDVVKQLGNTAKFNVTYTLTMPKVEYNTSEQATNKVVSDVDLVRADDGASVSWCSNDGKVTIKYPNYTFGTGGLSKGDKIYAVRVDDYRGGWSWDAAEYSDYNGGVYEGNVLIHFVIEKTTKITA